MAPFLNKHEIIDIRKFTKKQWKTFVDAKISSENRNFLIEWSKNYKKINSLDLENEEYERKQYLYKLSLAQARIKFRERSKTMKLCRTHFSSDRSNFDAVFQCFHCPKIDNLIHLSISIFRII